MAGERGWGAHLLASCPRVPRRAGRPQRSKGKTNANGVPSPVQSSHGLKPSVMAQKPGSLSPVPLLPQAGPSPCTCGKHETRLDSLLTRPGPSSAFTTKAPPSPSANVTATDLLGLLHLGLDGSLHLPLTDWRCPPHSLLPCSGLLPSLTHVNCLCH